MGRRSCLLPANPKPSPFALMKEPLRPSMIPERPDLPMLSFWKQENINSFLVMCLLEPSRSMKPESLNSARKSAASRLPLPEWLPGKKTERSLPGRKCFHTATWTCDSGFWIDCRKKSRSPEKRAISCPVWQRERFLWTPLSHN